MVGINGEMPNEARQTRRTQPNSEMNLGVLVTLSVCQILLQRKTRTCLVLDRIDRKGTIFSMKYLVSVLQERKQRELDYVNESFPSVPHLDSQSAVHRFAGANFRTSIYENVSGADSRESGSSAKAMLY